MPSISREDEIRMLKTEADSLKRSQKDIEKRLSELEKEE
jgi:predicted  nucleic acid-binding Zn-ribbon protein